MPVSLRSATEKLEDFNDQVLVNRVHYIFPNTVKRKQDNEKIGLRDESRVEGCCCLTIRFIFLRT